MKKIKSLFKRGYNKSNRQIYDSVVDGSEWVTEGEGFATVKYDGTSCMIRDGKLYKRYDRRAAKATRRKRVKNRPFVQEDFKEAPDGWISAEDTPNEYTGHWPGWLLVGDGPEDKWHRAALEHDLDMMGVNHIDGTYELVGPKVQSNPYELSHHTLWQHGKTRINAPRTFDKLKEFFRIEEIEGIVWHHSDGHMVKIKRRDFGFEWPVINTRKVNFS